MHGFLSTRGFWKVKAGVFYDEHPRGKTWFHPQLGIMVSDVKPDNFYTTPGGDVVPLDLIVQYFEDTHPLRKLFAANLAE